MDSTAVDNAGWLSTPTEMDLNRFLDGMALDEESEDAWHMSWRVPSDLAAFFSHPEASIHLSGLDCMRFERAYTSLRRERATEFLRDDELRGHLQRLVAEYMLDPVSFDPGAARDERLRTFFRRVRRPLQSYDVLIPLKHVASVASPVEVWDASILTITEEQVLRFALFGQSLDESGLIQFVGQPAILLQEAGTAPGAVVSRARERARSRLHILRVYLTHKWRLSPEALLFSLGSHSLVRNATLNKGLHFAWQRGREPLPVHLSDHLSSSFTSIHSEHALLATLSPDLRSVIERALNWMGTGLEDDLPFRRLTSYVTALEIMLVDKGHAKGEQIVRRLATLAAHCDASMSHPGRLRQVYRLRNAIAHDGETDVQDGDTVHAAFGAARDVVGWTVRLAAQHSIHDREKLLKWLDESPRRHDVERWLNELDPLRAASRKF